MFRRPLPGPTGPLLSTRTEEPRAIFWHEVSALVALLLVLSVFVYYAQFSGSLQWFLGIVFLAGFALFAWGLIVRRTADPAPLAGPPAADTYRAGDLATLAGAVRRASRGLVYSQVLVASRARAAFVERARVSLGLSSEAILELQRDPAALRRIFRDAVLEDFLRTEASDVQERYRWVLGARARGGFAREFRAVLARMEAWR